MRYEILGYVDQYYKKDMYLAVYEIGLEPLNDPNMWPKVSAYPLLPPPYRKMPGRLKVKRRKAPQEDPKRPGNLTRHGMQMKCQHCFAIGHNKRGCPKKDQPAAVRPPKVKCYLINGILLLLYEFYQ